MAVPVALTIAGSDSSGGAGIQADLKTFSALGVYGATVITALTAQNTVGVQAVHPVPADFVAEQFRSVTDDLDVRAVKTGMLATAAIIETTAHHLAERTDTLVVVDPVMVATSGDPLLAPDAVAAMRDTLVPVADLITPNLNEAACLLDTGVARSHAEMAEQGRALLGLGCDAVLVKGGHLIDERGQERNDPIGGGAPVAQRTRQAEALDVLVTRSDAVWLHAPRVDTRNTHGTGCTLSAAIVAEIVLGQHLFDAVTNAKWFLTGALEAARDMDLGSGHGPVNHLHEIQAWSTG
ncbi:MAG: bifunctional hydroxymethylpyrimidine kinase/phosphomethylpyrimidine kinase [Pseudomonadota bacterium]